MGIYSDLIQKTGYFELICLSVNILDTMQQAMQSGQPSEAFHGYHAMGSGLHEVIVKAIKYLVEASAVAIVAYLLPRNKMSLNEVVTLALTAGAVFAILDLYAPGVAMSTRQGVGFASGFGLLPPMGGVALGPGVTVPGIPPLV
jgi:hypothetical protein